MYFFYLKLRKNRKKYYIFSFISIYIENKLFSKYKDQLNINKNIFTHDYFLHSKITELLYIVLLKNSSSVIGYYQNFKNYLDICPEKVILLFRPLFSFASSHLHHQQQMALIVNALTVGKAGSGGGSKIVHRYQLSVYIGCYDSEQSCLTESQSIIRETSPGSFNNFLGDRYTSSYLSFVKNKAESVSCLEENVG